MTDSTTAAPAAQAAAGLARDGVAAVTDSFVGLQRTVRRSKARMAAAAGDDVESATHLLLIAVAAEGPMRASALAASVGSDLSTVSRQVTVLVSRGLLERRADQLDGRASLLALTRAGRDAVSEHERGRHAFFAEVLDGWSPQELGLFAQQLQRFTAAYDHVHAARMNLRAGPADCRPEPAAPVTELPPTTAAPERP